MVLNRSKCWSYVLGLIWFGLSSSCHNTIDDLCENGECCWPQEKNTFVRRLDGRRAGLLGSGFVFQDQIGASSYGPIQSCLMCPAQTEQIKAMKLEDNMLTNFVYETNNKFRLVDSTRAYPYQVWGTLYELTEVNKITSAPVYVFHLDRAEKAY